MTSTTLTAPPKPPPAEKERAQIGERPKGSQVRLDTAHSTRRPRKWQRILRAFLDGRAMTRFDAERIGDHVLHSTVSKLEAKGIVILRCDTTVSGYMGLATHVCRYWLAPQSRERAADLLGDAP